VWYASATTMVWRLTKLPPAPRPGHDIKPYELRGWCFFELAVGEMITAGGCVLDLGLAVEADGTCFDASRFLGGGYGGGWVAAKDDPMGASQPTVAKTCSQQRKFPIGAAAFSDALDGKGADGQARVFTNGADAEFVKGKYADTFTAVVAGASELNLANVGLFAPLAELAPALELCGPRLRALDLSKNGRLSGGLEALGACAVLETLKLRECRGLTGDLGPLQGLTTLTHLDLSCCYELTGDLGPLQGLTTLTHLDLSCCYELTGDLGPLQGLTQLTHLDLNNCERLIGDVWPLEGLTQLTHLGLYDCNKLTGDKDGLMEAAKRRRA